MDKFFFLIQTLRASFYKEKETAPGLSGLIVNFLTSIIAQPQKSQTCLPEKVLVQLLWNKPFQVYLLETIKLFELSWETERCLRWIFSVF